MLGSSSPDSVGIFKMKYELIFSWDLYVFEKK